MDIILVIILTGVAFAIASIKLGINLEVDSEKKLDGSNSVSVGFRKFPISKASLLEPTKDTCNLVSPDGTFPEGESEEDIKGLEYFRLILDTKKEAEAEFMSLCLHSNSSKIETVGLGKKFIELKSHPASDTCLYTVSLLPGEGSKWIVRSRWENAKGEPV